MKKGKITCKILKSIRRKIADANGISYQPAECHFEGDCTGTCPACEQEIRYLEAQLKVRMEHKGSRSGGRGLCRNRPFCRMQQAAEVRQRTEWNRRAAPRRES